MFSKFVYNEISSMIKLLHLLTTNIFDTLFGLANAVSSVLLFYFYAPPGDKQFSMNLSWTLVSFAFIFPLTMTINECYKRRDSALQSLAQLRSCCASFLLGHMDLDWPVDTKNMGRNFESQRGKNLAPTHVAWVFDRLNSFVDALFNGISAKSMYQGRYDLSDAGLKERQRAEDYINAQKVEIISASRCLSRCNEALKRSGANPSEVSRLHQIIMQMMQIQENIFNVKMYHTPLGLRSLTRVFILVTPWLFGPYHVLVANNTNLAFAIVTSCITTLSMQGLFNIRHELEDPFIRSELHGHSFGGIFVTREMRDIKEKLNTIYQQPADASSDATYGFRP